MIEQCYALGWHDTDVLVWKQSHTGICPPLYCATLIILSTLPTEESQAERELMESKAWSGDRIEQPESGT